MISRWENRLVRGQDAHGSGAFVAPRGGKRHKGTDYVFEPGEAVHSPIEGIVTRTGYAYEGEAYRLIEILSHKGYLLWRFLYVDPKVSAGDKVLPDDVIGKAQDIAAKYNRPKKVMTNHVHVEINLNPRGVLGGQDGN